MAEFGGYGGWPPENTSQEGSLNQKVAAELDVVQDRHPVEEFHFLKGAGDSLGSDHVRFQRQDVLPLEKDLSLLGAVMGVDAVEQAGLAGAIGPDDG